MAKEDGTVTAPGVPSFTCPVCGMTSYHPADIANGYCGNCHAFTGESPDGADWHYTVRVDRRGWPDPDTGPDGPMSREEALARVTGPDPHSMWRTIALGPVTGPGGGDYCNVCENFPCLGNHPPGGAL